MSTSQARVAERTSVSIAEIIRKNERDILEEWVKSQLDAVTLRKDLLSEDALRAQSRQFLQIFIHALQGSDNIGTSEWESVKQMLSEVSRTRAKQGFSSSETATFVFSLKQPLFERLRK